jgi:hypothetical protein
MTDADDTQEMTSEEITEIMSTAADRVIVFFNSLAPAVVSAIREMEKMSVIMKEMKVLYPHGRGIYRRDGR